MKFYDLWPHVAVVPFMSSIIFFVLAREKEPARRLLASVHGWAALLVLPFSVLVATKHPGLGTSLGLPGILTLGGVSAVSVFYAIATLRVRWLYHLLHIPTLFVIATSFVTSVFILAGAQ